jgi:hypothetical protein
VSDVVENGSSELKADLEALESRLLQEMEEKQVRKWTSLSKYIHIYKTLAYPTRLYFIRLSKTCPSVRVLHETARNVHWHEWF